MTTTQKLETGQNRYRVEANLNLYPVIGFDIAAENENEAEHRAEKVLDRIEATISVAIPESDCVEVYLDPNNIEPLLLSQLKTGHNRYRAEANFRLYAVINFDIVAENDTDAEHRAKKVLDEIEPTISLTTPESYSVEVDFSCEDVEPELLSVGKIEETDFGLPGAISPN